ncbi:MULTISPECIES: 2Fe-2S iron-sulfur cluster-binding protein [Sorangium]|uniref:2Fe-2S iron-sulfur cluster-binding protein n=1 Tax=Sorangium atrum TaxID=2995308 RepID=A0ABT5CDZ7_9BACT|nr:2Fe-2S iron-sulfur cluster-binding protein [Sorangium aterium]MDC0684661.1 2Fe-2S iron-sulfur cluster-binding protein [Sorangium aterium]
MPTVVFEDGALGRAVTAEVGAGRLIDVCDDARAPVVFSCRDARCATCRVEVVEGEQLLDPPARGELDLLERLGAPPRLRLACQAVLRAGPGLVRLRGVVGREG